MDHPLKQTLEITEIQIFLCSHVLKDWKHLAMRNQMKWRTRYTLFSRLAMVLKIIFNFPLDKMWKINKEVIQNRVKLNLEFLFAKVVGITQKASTKIQVNL